MWVDVTVAKHKSEHHPGLRIANQCGDDGGVSQAPGVADGPTKTQGRQIFSSQATALHRQPSSPNTANPPSSIGKAAGKGTGAIPALKANSKSGSNVIGPKISCSVSSTSVSLLPISAAPTMKSPKMDVASESTLLNWNPISNPSKFPKTGSSSGIIPSGAGSSSKIYKRHTECNDFIKVSSNETQQFVDRDWRRDDGFIKECKPASLKTG